MAESQIYDEEILHTAVRPVETFLNKTQSMSFFKKNVRSIRKVFGCTGRNDSHFLSMVWCHEAASNYLKMIKKKEKGVKHAAGRKSDITDDIVTYWLNKMGDVFYWQKTLELW